MISLDEFKRVELRIAEVIAAESVPGSDRLLKLTVKLDDHTRTLVGGVAKSYVPEDLLGVQVVVAANLAPAKIRGIESQGMLLGVQCTDPSLATLLTVARRVPNGAVVS